jgi:hypothetical protein
MIVVSEFLSFHYNTLWNSFTSIKFMLQIDYTEMQACNQRSNFRIDHRGLMMFEDPVSEFRNSFFNKFHLHRY